MNYFDVKEETKELIYERRAKNVDSLVCRDIMLSIIVPVYNTEKYLAKCLDSIIQALEKVEIKTEVLVINDGSTDNSKIVIEKYKNEHPQLIAAYDKPNGGLSDVKIWIGP